MDRRAEFNHHRGKVAGLTRSRRADDPDLAAARIAMWAASESPDRLAELVNAVSNVAPSLSRDERKRVLAALKGDPR